MRRLYLVRHGEAVTNRLQVVMSHADPLSEVGVSQARDVAERLSAVAIDHIVCSKYTRAVQTAKIIQEKLNAPLEVSDMLHEKKSPTSLLGQSLLSERVQQYIVDMNTHMANKDWHLDDDENLYQSFERARLFLKTIKKHPADAVLAVTHGWLLRDMLALTVLGIDADIATAKPPFNNVDHQNTGITIFDYNAKKDLWSLVTWNEHAHVKTTRSERAILDRVVKTG